MHTAYWARPLIELKKVVIRNKLFVPIMNMRQLVEIIQKG